MLGWVFRVIGILGLALTGSLTAAAVCAIALVVASQLEEDSFWRWVIGAATIVVGILILFLFNFFLGALALVVCALSALAPQSVPR